MPYLKRRFNAFDGPIVSISISAPGTPLSRSPHRVVPVQALIDTGANSTAIFASAAAAAGVLSYEKRNMVSANHTKPASIYIVDLQIHLSEIVVFPALEVVEFEAAPYSKFQALLGRDVLCQGASTFTMAKDVYKLRLYPRSA